MINILLLFYLLTLLGTLNCQQTSFVNQDSKIKGFAEKQWYKDNIPFVEVPDSNIEEVYYYRWSSHKRHLRYTTLGSGYSVTEFVHNVGYTQKFETIVAAAGHHIYETRWLRNQKYVKDYINFYARQNSDEGNHQYSEWVTDAAYKSFLLNGDKEFIKSQLDGFVRNYNLWADHFESKLGLYWISPLWDAQEYSASSVQTSDKFGGGIGYRPSFNSEMYANAVAISKIAQMNNDSKIANDFKNKATALREAIINRLWDKQRNFFYHMQRDNNSNNNLLDAREEVGFYPWRWQVPDDRFNFSSAWEQLFDVNGFNSKYGPTTCEMRSKWYIGNQTHDCCWWNGNSWPYSTSHTISSLAAQVKHYKQQNPKITADHYVESLHKYAITQYKNGVPYVAECHSPQGDFWVCDNKNHSEHYAHSTFNDNVLGELIGITPREDNVFEVNPLIPSSWKYFIAENVPYHGHLITVLFDSDGTRYKVGTGMKVYVDGKLIASQENIGIMTVNISSPIIPTENNKKIENYAANVRRQGYPLPSASFIGEGSTWQAIDGRIFYDIIPSNRWSNLKSQHDSDWFAVDFGRVKTINQVSIYIYSDIVNGTGQTDCPTKMNVQYHDGNNWVDAENQVSTPTNCSPNDVNRISFKSVKTNQVRVVFTRNKAKDYYVGITEFEVWAEWPQASPNTYEAEDAVVTDANIHSSSTASGGYYVGQIDSRIANVEFSGIYSSIAGNFKMKVYYANAMNQSTHTVKINNIHTVTVSYPPTKGGWGHFSDDTYVEATIPLLRGNNVLIFTHGNEFAELDKISIN